MGSRAKTTGQTGLGQTGLDRQPVYQTVDHWHALLSESLVVLGPHAKRVHGLAESREKFGLGEIIQNYGSASRPELLSLLEALDEANPTFDFRSTLSLPDGRQAEVHWIGRLEPAGDRVGGVIVISEEADSLRPAGTATH